MCIGSRFDRNSRAYRAQQILWHRCRRAAHDLDRQQEGELGRLVEEHQCGFAVEEGDVDSLESAITLLSHDRDLCARMGTRARSMLDHHFTRRQAFDYWQTLISKVELGQPSEEPW
jgi:hypothetical protein